MELPTFASPVDQAAAAPYLMAFGRAGDLRQTGDMAMVSSMHPQAGRVLVVRVGWMLFYGGKVPGDERPVLIRATSALNSITF